MKYTSKLEKCVRLAEELLKAEAIVPGEYECITTPEVSGLIAHEAFGHGVEMDMFVKNRALGAKYIDEYVAEIYIKNLRTKYGYCKSRNKST